MHLNRRLLLALTVLAALVLAGIGGPAWADRLGAGVQRPAGDGVPSGNRPAGTVPVLPPHVMLPPHVYGASVPQTTSQPAVVGSCATAFLGPAPAGVTYDATQVPDASLAGTLPGNIIGCGIKIEAHPATTNLGAEVRVCFPTPEVGFAYYYDGTQWVKTTLDPKDGQSCIDIPSTARNPVTSALFDQ